MLRRQRLLDFIHEYIDRKLLLVSASAGYGKTSLLVDFASDTELPVCWYSLDSSDRDPRVFLEYLIASIRRKFPRFGGRSAALLENAEPQLNLDSFVGALVADIQNDIDSYFVLALDDYHFVDNSVAVNQIVDRLLHYLPDNVHLILASRTLPTLLNLTRLTARQQIAGLGVGDLRFHADEIRELMQQNYRLEITEAVAQQLAEQSEGWIAGIVLTTPTLWRGLFKEWVKGYGPGSQLFDYLAGEVFAQQSEPLQHFLLDTSILDQVNPPLANELLGLKDAADLLRTVEQRNLFITRLEENWYRYHHLFREFLETRLKQSNAVRFRELHTRAAELFERHGNTGEAIEHWLRAEAPDHAATLIELIADELFDQGRWTTLSRWLDALSASLLLEHPELLLLRAKMYAEQGAPEQARNAFDSARAEFERRGDERNVARVLIEDAYVDGNPATAMEKCRAALLLLPAREFALNAMAHRTLSGALLRRGDYAGATTQLERASELYQLANDRYHHAMVENDLGMAFQLRGDQQKADVHFENALTHWRKLNSAANLANTLNSIAVSRYQRGQLADARSMLEEALVEARRAVYLRVEAYILASLGDLYRDTGEHERALQAYAEASDIAEKTREDFLLTLVRIAVGDVWRLSGDLNTSEQVLENALHLATAHNSDYEVALAQTALGALRLEQVDYTAALGHLQHALPVLTRMHTEREAARVYYFLAQVAWRRKRYEEAARYLRALAALGKPLGEDQFLMCEGAHAIPLLEFAVERRIARAYFQGTLTRLGRAAAHAPFSLEATEAAFPLLEVFVLGEGKVLLNGRVVDKTAWQTTTTKELFFFFATHPTGWRKEQIITELWPDSSPGQGNDLFHSSVYRIRRALFPECLVFRNGLYSLNPEAASWLDVDEFERLLSESEEVKTEASRIELLQRAVDLYRGDYVQEFYSDWCRVRRQTLQEKYLAAASRLARLYADQGENERAIHLYQAALAKDPLHEESYHELIELHARLGDRSSAIQVYQQCVTVFAAELGMMPPPETTALYQEIVRRASSK